MWLAGIFRASLLLASVGIFGVMPYSTIRRTREMGIQPGRRSTGIAATDFVTLASGAIFLVAVALGANTIPARAASRIQPTIALRHE